MKCVVNTADSKILFLPAFLYLFPLWCFFLCLFFSHTRDINDTSSILRQLIRLQIMYKTLSIRDPLRICLELTKSVTFILKQHYQLANEVTVCIRTECYICTQAALSTLKWDDCVWSPLLVVYDDVWEILLTSSIRWSFTDEVLAFKLVNQSTRQKAETL